MSSSSKHPPKKAAVGAAGPTDVHTLYDQCSASEKALTRDSFDKLKMHLVRELHFRIPIFDVFSDKNYASPVQASELVSRYSLLRAVFREAMCADDRLRAFARWLWAELDVQPEDSLGEELMARLTSDTRKRVNKIPWNDFYYASLVEIWLRYSKRLFADAADAKAHGANLTQSLESLGFRSDIVNIFVDKSWRSPIELTCEWLAGRGGIQMSKARKDADMARTLRNAYSRVRGARSRRQLKCIFCAKPAVSEFYAHDLIMASHCEDHAVERLPDLLSAWSDSVGRRWWRSGGIIYCELPATAAP